VNTYVITKGGGDLRLFWGRDGWAANSHFASRYNTWDAAERALKLLGLDRELGVKVYELEVFRQEPDSGEFTDE